VYLCTFQVLIPGQKSPKALALSRINYEQEPKNLSLGVNFVYAVDDCFGGADGSEYDGAMEQKKAFKILKSSCGMIL
jgi:hypothetical protein